MTLKVVIKNSVEALDLKAQVDQVCGPNDFAWRYNPAVNDYFGATVLTPGTAEFEFVDKKWETYFQLKWGV